MSLHSFRSAHHSWGSPGSVRRSEPGYWAVKYLGSGFYKLTAAAGALVVASRVMFRTDDDYGRQVMREFSVCFYSGVGVFLQSFQWPLPIPATVESERATQAALLRCIFENPFRPLTPQSSSLLTFNDSLVVKLARAAYEERLLPEANLDQSRLAAMADALEEAGCTNQDMLSHCRNGGTHIRGCWAVDLILGKQ